MNVASTAAFQPGPFMACYYASKAYVLHFSEAIGNELKDAGGDIERVGKSTWSGIEDAATSGWDAVKSIF